VQINVQEMHVRAILTHNLDGTFWIGKRPDWMNGLELDGWNTEVSFEGRSVAFEYMRGYWHKGDADDRPGLKRKKICVRRIGLFCSSFGHLLTDQRFRSNWWLASEP
jgi:hypothetical protein